MRKGCDSEGSGERQKARAQKDKYLIPDLQLRVPIGVLIDLLPDLLALVGVIPVEIEGDEGLHAVARRGVVGVAREGASV